MYGLNNDTIRSFNKINNKNNHEKIIEPPNKQSVFLEPELKKKKKKKKKKSNRIY